MKIYEELNSSKNITWCLGIVIASSLTNLIIYDVFIHEQPVKHTVELRKLF